jgi:hypothetical protein
MTRLFSVVVDAVDHRAQAEWWSIALDTPVVGVADDEAWIQPVDAPEIDFVPVGEPKVGKNRIHFDLATYSRTEHATLVARLVEAGAQRIDVGQPDEADWVVLADPEGNEFCVVEPRPAHGYSTRIAEIGVDTAAVDEAVAFWRLASGWDLVRAEPGWGMLRAQSGRGPYLFLVQETEPKAGQNRIHLDVAPRVGEDQAAAVDDLVAAGARHLDIGQGDVPWVVMEDPGGNEFCVLTPR